MNSELVETYKKLVGHYRTQTAAAKAFGVAQPSVRAWIEGKAKMSEKVAIRVQKATEGKFKAVDLCPSLKEMAELNLQAK